MTQEPTQDPETKALAAKPKIYRLKPMVAVRLCAEATLFIILLARPLILLVLGKLWALGWTYKIVVAVLGLIGLLMLPVYGFITYQVTVTEDELTTHSLVRKRSCPLALMSGIKRRANLSWIRYVVEYEGGELSFPIWLKNCDELVDLLRKSMPAGAAGKQSPLNRLFKQDPLSIILQVGQAAAGLIFTAVVWYFAFTLYRSGSAGISAADEGLVAVFALVITGILIWRSIVVALMPSKIILREEDLSLYTLFFEKKVRWIEVRTVKEPFPLLPEGFMVHTQKGNYLVGNGMDSADELSDAIKERMGKFKS